MTFDVFLEALPKIAKFKHPELYREKASRALCALIKQSLSPLCKDLMTTGDNYDSLFVEDDCKILLRSVLESLREVYTAYFPWELRGTDAPDVINNKSQRSLLTFLQEFDIVPQLLSKNFLVKLWRDLVTLRDSNMFAALSLLQNPSDDIGVLFPFSKFLLVLYISAYRGYADDEEVGTSPPIERLMLLLERMELSKGFLSLTAKNTRLSLTPPKAIINQVLYPETMNIDEFSRGADEVSLSILQTQQQEVGLSIGQEAQDKVIEHKERLTGIFQAYCSFGEPMNTTRMRSAKFVKLLRDCGLISEFNTSRSRSTKKSPISSVEADLVHAKLCRKMRYSQGFDFDTFLKALEIIAKRVYKDTELDASFIQLIEGFILKLENEWNTTRAAGSSSIQTILDQLRSEEIVELLGVVHTSVLYYYSFYADTRGLMNFNGFLRFATDFTIFPELLPKSKLLRVFCCFASIHSQTEQPEVSVSKYSLSDSRSIEVSDSNLIDEHLFVEAIAVISALVMYREPEPGIVERICYLMERMSQSPGPEKVLLGNGHNRATTGDPTDMLGLLRSRYPHMFGDAQSKEGFDELLLDMSALED
eukprot:CAMPEP_0204908800 /NCGR_PEP_ID=MMETSP1397-20131031/7680_1 /ASSEMBLY_ACC=CAM_ASM_000891 /TAXON_ID=49980 /ORGANISM="Climacostomum Climacostomum virens, Strain Stock W-24" /LENGTH=589 /DNA_ID=CAMNT_0052078451 /DNA_START=143 /DNA_END=1909 /DNA_ORIENTATION=+